MVKGFWHLMLNLTGGIYDLIGYIYNIFYFLCGFQLFSDSDYTDIVKKIYVILGIVMAFVLAYSLLKAVINPDEFSKGETSFPKLIKNVVVSLVIIVVLPTIFSVAFNIQNSLLNYNVIPKLILGETTDLENGSSLDINVDGNSVNGGSYISFHTLNAFLTPNLDSGICGEKDSNSCRENIKGDGTWGFRNGASLFKTDEEVLGGKSFTYYSEYSEAIRDGDLSFNFIFAIAAGLFICYVLLNFCFDMALRVIKLAFYQIIAPIPVICRIIPGGKLKDVFSKWVKQVISLFIEVFVRIGALTFGVYLIGVVVEKWNSTKLNSSLLSGFGAKTIVEALLIMSVIMFIKQIPKLIGDLFGLDTGGMKLGLMDKLAAGGALAAGAMAGGLAGTIGRNTIAAGKNFKNAKGLSGKVKAGILGAASIGAGGLSGAVRGFKAGKGAKNFGDVKNASATAVAGATKAREKRDTYRANHTGANFLETGTNVAMGHISDALGKAGRWLGIDDGLAVLQGEKDSYKAFLDNDSETDNVAVDLMGRDAISQNALIMQAAGGPRMSFDAMKEQLDNDRKATASAMIGRQLVDFNGKTHTINTESDYANYLSVKKAQLSKAERNLKKYVKRFAYQDDGIAKMTNDVAINDILNNQDVSRSSSLMNKVANVNVSSEAMASRIDALSTHSWNASLSGSVVQDFKGNTITLTDAASYDAYKSLLHAQSDEANALMRNYITACVESSDSNRFNDIQMSLANDGYTFDTSRVVSDLDFGDGEVQRMNKIHSYSEDVRNLISENPSILAHLNELISDPNNRVTDINGPDAWEKMDRLINNIKDRNIDINTEINKLLREKAAKEGNNGGNKK